MSATSDIAQRAAEQASVLLDTLWPSDEQRVKEIIQSAIDEACTEKDAEIERLKTETAALRLLLKGARSLIVLEMPDWRRWEKRIQEIDAVLFPNDKP